MTELSELLENINVLLYSINNHKTQSGNIFYKEIDGKHLLNLCIEIDNMCAKIRSKLNPIVDEKPITVDEKKKIENYNDYYALFKPKEVELIKAEADNVNHPSHYTWLKDLCGIEVIDITRHMNFNLGNCIKYILRAGHKTEQGMTNKEKRIEDLKKAQFYINDEIERLEIK